MGASGEVGSQTWRRQPRRAPPDAADGTFFADPLPQILTEARNLCARGSFSPHDETDSPPDVPAARGLRRGERAGPARTGDAAGADRAARASAHKRLRADAVARRCLARGYHHRP